MGGCDGSKEAIMALTKRFNGKVYHFQTQYHNESRAYSHAQKLRDQGHKARVVKVDFMTWEIYAR